MKIPNMTDIPGEEEVTFMFCWKVGMKVDRIKIRVGIWRIVLNKYKQKLMGGNIDFRIVEILLFPENLYPINIIKVTIRNKKLRIIISITV